MHRDLNPSNVLLAPDGPKVTHFGTSRAAYGTQLTVTGLAIGTLRELIFRPFRMSASASWVRDPDIGRDLPRCARAGA